ncbi:MAG: O-acetyl-ADP-ribose deacetylase [Deltaproteobacteria bacterium]|nr:O-acetyl-ADP-ribose deacetylase [Deltaproteobacteria bacterium]
MEVAVNKGRIVLVQGDIAEADTEAIVNAANSGLKGGGGVDGAIHRAGGPQIMEECRIIGYCPTGGAVVTRAGALKARFIIHAVGPVYRDGTKGEAGLLKSVYRESIKRASELGVRSLSFPAISTGAYGYPLRQAAQIALSAIIEYFREHDDIDVVAFILFDKESYDVFEKELKTLV